MTRNNLRICFLFSLVVDKVELLFNGSQELFFLPHLNSFPRCVVFSYTDLGVIPTKRRFSILTKLFSHTNMKKLRNTKSDCLGER